jgi:hypothetical protein
MIGRQLSQVGDVLADFGEHAIPPLQIAIVAGDEVGALLRLRFVQAGNDYGELGENLVGMRYPAVRLDIALRVAVRDDGDDDQKRNRNAKAGGHFALD